MSIVFIDIHGSVSTPKNTQMKKKTEYKKYHAPELRATSWSHKLLSTRLLGLQFPHTLKSEAPYRHYCQAVGTYEYRNNLETKRKIQCCYLAATNLCNILQLKALTLNWNIATHRNQIFTHTKVIENDMITNHENGDIVIHHIILHVTHHKRWI